MDIAELLSEIDHLKKEDLAQLKARIEEREHELSQQEHPQTADEWRKAIRNFLTEFWADTPNDEKDEIISAIRYKNIPPDKTV